MGGEPVLADLRHVDQAALDHVPAQDTLSTTQNEETQQLDGKDTAHAPSDQEPEKR